MFGFFRNSKSRRLERVVKASQGGVYARLDGTRELAELLEVQAPQLLRRYPQIVETLTLNDRFLQALAKAVPPNDPAYELPQAYPRPLPVSMLTPRAMGFVSVRKPAPVLRLIKGRKPHE